jgi:plasmid stabilization system protein ParE
MNVVWTPKAASDFEEIVSYVVAKRQQKEAQSFIDEVHNTVKQLQHNPTMFEFSTKIPHVRKGKIDRYTMIYQVDEDRIVLLNFMDNRIHLF